MGYVLTDETIKQLLIETRVYRDMVFVMYTDKSAIRFGQNKKDWFDERLKEYLKTYKTEREAKFRLQLFHNHEHMCSKKDAVKLITKVCHDFEKRYPKLIYRLSTDWRQGGRREKGNVVMVSFWLDVDP